MWVKSGTENINVMEWFLISISKSNCKWKKTMWCSIGELWEAQETGLNSEKDYNWACGLLMQSMVTERWHGTAKLCGHAPGLQRLWRSCADIVGNRTWMNECRTMVGMYHSLRPPREFSLEGGVLLYLCLFIHSHTMNPSSALKSSNWRQWVCWQGQACQDSVSENLL